MPLAVQRRWILLTICALGSAIWLSLLPGAALAQAARYEYQPGELLIKFVPGTPAAQVDSILSALGASRAATYRSIGATHERISRMSVEQAVARFRGDRRVLYIEPNYVVHASVIPNDPNFALQWDFHNTGQTGGTPGADIHAPEAWDITTGSPSVLVAIIDTGVQYYHADLSANAFTNPGEISTNGIDDDGNGFIDDVHGWSFIENFLHTHDPNDDNGHGTHVAGTVGAVGNNGLFVTGVAWHVTLLPVKFLDYTGAGTVANAIAAIEYATLMGAKVMNNSWGGGPYSQALYDAIRAAGEAGAVFVAAAGNSGTDNDLYPEYPAGYDLPNVISVAASDANDHLAAFSSYGATSVDLAAPGVNIVSTGLENRYTTLSGTSMATPHVSGAAALILSRFPNMDPASVKRLILASVDPIPSLSGRVASGGRLNIARALSNADSLPPDPISDVSLTRIDGQWADLQWTATGDDGRVGQAERYELRYSTAAITPDNFATATLVRGLAAPLPAGALEHAHITGLGFNTTFYFAVLARDEYGNASLISNVVSGTTLGPPLAGLTSASLDADLFTGQSVTRSLTVTNSGLSELAYHFIVQPRIVPAAMGARVGRVITPARRILAPSGLALSAGAIPQPDASHRYAAGRAAASRVQAAPALPMSQAAPTVGYRVLMLTASGGVGPMRDLLAAYPDLVQVDVMDLTEGLPSLDQLKAYQAVLVSVGATLPDPFGLGDVLADYADWGGGVVLSLASFIQGFEIRGRLLSGGYMPFSLGSGPGPSSSLGQFDPLHPIMNGVTTLTGDLLGQVQPAPGAQLVARWANSRPLAATQGAHVVAFNFYYDEAGFWSGDAPRLLHNAIVWAGAAAPFLTVDGDSGVVVPGSSVDVQVRLDAARLFGGDYVSDVVMHSNDPKHSELTLRSNLHVNGAPAIVVSPSSLDFGRALIGYSVTETVTVTNLGTEPLNVTGITATAPELQVTQSAFAVSPGQRMQLLATWTPLNAGLLSGSLNISSNDPDDPVHPLPLTGQAVLPSGIFVTPASVGADLPSGQSTTRSIVLSNTGGSDLNFTLGWRPQFPPGAGSRALPINSGARRTLTYVGATPSGRSPPNAPNSPGMERMGAARTGTQASPSVPDILLLTTVNVNHTVEAALNALGRAYDLIATDDFTTIDFSPYRTVIVCMDGGAVDELDCQALANAAIAGRLIFMLGGSDSPPYYQGLQEFLVAHSGQQGWKASAHPQLVVVNPADPLASGLPQTGSFSNVAAAYYMVRITDPQALVAVRNGDGKPILVHKPMGAGTLVYYTAAPDTQYWSAPSDDAILNQIVANALKFEAPIWISVAPKSGTIPPGGQQTLDVALDATRLNGGTYDASVVINSNAPTQPTLEIPAHLQVTGIPRILVSAASLDFGQLFMTVSRSETLTVTNPGTDLLNVNFLTTTPQDYAVTSGPFSLRPGESYPLAVTFLPQTPARVAGTLEIHCDDPDHPVVTVALTGEGLPPPVIGFSPSSLSFSVTSGSPSSGGLTIQNGGTSVLNYRIVTRASPNPVAAAAAAPAAARSAGAPPAGASNVARTSANREPLNLAVRRTLSKSAGTVLVLADGGTESDVESLLSGAGYTVTIGPGGGSWDGTNPSPDGFAAMVLLDGPNFGSDMPTGGQSALLSYVAGGGGLILTEWILYEIEQGRYAALQPLVPMTRSSSSSGPSQYQVIQSHPVTAGVSPTFSIESGLTAGHANQGSELVALPDGEAVVVASEYGGGHVVEFGMAGNWSGYRPLAQPDLQRLFVNAADWVSLGSWLSIVPGSGTVSPGSSQQVQFTADAGQLLGGDYALDLVILNNDPVSPDPAIPVRLHVTGVPDVAASPAQLDFGGVFVSAAKTESLVVSNRGTDLLMVSGISVSPSVFAAPGGGFTLKPRQSQDVAVTFSAPGLGELDGSLVIHSDDPDQPDLHCALKGTGVSPPQLELTPTSLSADLLSGQQASQVLTVHNSGGSDLHFSVRPAMSPGGAPVTRASARSTPVARRRSPVPTAAGGPDTFGYQWKDSDDPDGTPFNWVEISALGTAIPLSGDDWNFGPIPIGFSFPLYGTNFTSIQVSSNGWLSFTSLVPQFAHWPLPSASAPENLLAVFWSDLTANPATVFYYNDGARLIVEYQNVRYSGGAIPLTFETLLYPDGRIVYQYLSMSGAQPNATIGIQNAARDDGLLIAFNSTYVHDQLAISIAPPPPWLSASPSQGTVAAGSQAPVQVRFNPTGLNTGDFAGQLDVSSDDPTNTLQKVPIALHVTGAPSLTITPARLDFGPLLLRVARAETLTAANVGSELVNVSSVELVNPAFAAPTAGFSVAPAGPKPIIVTFTPAVLGTADGSITFHSNDPLHGSISIALHGEAVTPPHAALSPSLIQDVLGPSEVHTVTLRLDNRGGSPLEWSAQTFGLAPASASEVPTARVLETEAAGSAAREWSAAAIDAFRSAARPAHSGPGAADVIGVPPSLPDALARLNACYLAVTDVIPSRFDFTEGETGYQILNGGQNMYKVGNLLSTDLDTDFAYSNNTIAPVKAFRAQFFTRKYPGLFVLAADLAGPTRFTVSGNLGANGNGSVDGATLALDYGGVFYLGLVKRVYGAGVPSVNHLTILVNPSSVSHSVPSDTHLDQETVGGLGSITRFYYLLFAGAGGAYISNADMSAIMLNFLTAISFAPAWLGISPSAGTVLPFAYQELNASLDSRPLALGDYSGDVFLQTSDPDTPGFTVPVNISVVTAPTATDVTLVSATADGGTVHVVWQSSSGTGLRATVQRATRGSGWADLGPIVPDGSGFMRFDDASVVPGAAYGYRLAISDGNGTRYVAETWVTLPLAAAFALFGLEPNPAVRDLRAAFSLPDDHPASIELLDLAGRRVRYQAVGALGAGRHVVSLGAGGQLPSGIYLVRLQRANRELVSKCVVMR